MSLEYTAIFHGSMDDSFWMKISGSFLIFVPKGFWVLELTVYVLGRIKTMFASGNPTFCHIK